MKLFLSFDYELFLGENYDSPEVVLFEMTRKICGVLDDCGVKGTFFADVFSAIQYRKYGLNDYADGFEAQIKWIIKNGHDVQLHIHPHWVMSQYKDGKWFHQKEYYRISEFEHDVIDPFGNKHNINSLIREGKEYLERICRIEKRDYVCNSFRAGGYAIQPYDKIVPSLIANGIKNDSSIATGTVDWNYWHRYNFLSVPKKRNYVITEKGEFYFELLAKGNYIREIPIGSIRNDYLKFILKKKKYKLPHRILLGSAIDLRDQRDLSKFKQLIKRMIIYPKTSMLFSLDELHYLQIVRGLKRLNKDCNIALIGHPKLFDDYRLINMRKMIIEVKRSIDRVEFSTMSNI